MGISVAQSCEAALSYYHKAAKKGTLLILQACMIYQEHMSRVERCLHLRAFSTFRIRTVLDYGEYPLWSRCCDSYT